MKPHLATLFGVAVVLTLLFPGLATASAGGPVFGSYWEQFLDYWQGVVQKQNGVIMGVLGVGVVALFIITRGKWRK